MFNGAKRKVLTGLYAHHVVMMADRKAELQRPVSDCNCVYESQLKNLKVNDVLSWCLRE